MSNVLALPNPAGLRASGALGTTSVSDQGRKYARVRFATSGGLWTTDTLSPELTLADKLTHALAQAKGAIRNSVRDLRPEQAASLATQIGDLLIPDNWEDGDEVLKVGSVHTLVRLVIAMARPAGNLTLTKRGNIVATWSDQHHTLRVEALADGRVSWAHVLRGDGVTHTKHQAADSIGGLLTALPQ